MHYNKVINIVIHSMLITFLITNLKIFKIETTTAETTLKTPFYTKILTCKNCHFNAVRQNDKIFCPAIYIVILCQFITIFYHYAVYFYQFWKRLTILLFHMKHFYFHTIKTIVSRETTQLNDKIKTFHVKQ